jgi:hypothetical protein
VALSEHMPFGLPQDAAQQLATVLADQQSERSRLDGAGVGSKADHLGHHTPRHHLLPTRPYPAQRSWARGRFELRTPAGKADHQCRLRLYRPQL